MQSQRTSHRLFTLLLAACLLLAPGCTSRVTLDTSIGTLTLIRAEVVDSFVLGGGWTIQAADGHQLLLLWFEGQVADGLDLDTSGITVVGDDGSRTAVASVGPLVQAGDGQLILPFYPPEGATAFTLHWQGNPPVDLTLAH